MTRINYSFYAEYLRNMKHCYLLVLFLFYIVYLLLGAAVFMAMERPREEQKCDEAKNFKRNLTQRIESGDRDWNVEKLDEIIKEIIEYNSFGISLSRNVTCPTNWNFQSSLFFSGTIITTIGYGNISPTMEASKLFCCFYAFIGIPLFAIMFNEFGKTFAKAFKSATFACTKNSTEIKTKTIILLVSFGTVSICIFCVLPAALFSSVEGWTFSNSVYYSFITLTTIGFGDFVAGSDPTKDYIAVYRILVYCWIVFGLAFMFTFIGIMQDMLRTTVVETPPNANLNGLSLQTRKAKQETSRLLPSDDGRYR